MSLQPDMCLYPIAAAIQCMHHGRTSALLCASFLSPELHRYQFAEMNDDGFGGATGCITRIVHNFQRDWIDYRGAS